MKHKLPALLKGDRDKRQCLGLVGCEVFFIVISDGDVDFVFKKKKDVDVVFSSRPVKRGTTLER